MLKDAPGATLIDSKVTTLALSLSIAIHLGLIVSLSMTKTKILKKPLKQIEVTYQAIKPKSIKQQPQEFKDLRALKEPKMKRKVKIDPKSKPVDSFAMQKQNFKDISKITDHHALNKKIVQRISPLELDRKVSIPVLKAEKISNSTYISYNQKIREKIRQRAYSYIDHPDFEAGEVYLTFVLGSNGKLNNLQIIDSKTSATSYLRNVGLRSIKESNPFPPFPRDLSFPELTFNVVISFEVQE